MKKKHPIRWILRRTRRRIPALLIMTAAAIINSLLGVAFALGTKEIIDTAVSGDGQAFSQAVLIQLGIILGILLCVSLHRYLIDRISFELDRDWKRDLLRVLLEGEYEKVSAYHSGELLNRLNNDVRVVDNGLIGILPGVASIAAKLAAALAVLITLEPWFTLALVGAGLAVVGATALLRRRIKDLHKRVSEENGRVSSFLQETLEKLLMVQAMDVSPEMEKRADVLMENRIRVQKQRQRISLFARFSVDTVSMGSGFVALVWCSVRILQGTMTFGSLTAITQLVGQVGQPFMSLSGIIPQYIAMTAAGERLMELDSLGEELPAAAEGSGLYEDLTALRGEGLSFSYDRDSILENSSFTIPKGSFTVITGGSGQGKSTLQKLMLGIFRPESGELYADCAGERIPLDRRTRKLFAYVPQGNLLLSGTLRENLLITRPEATEEEIRSAVTISCMDEYLSQLPRGLETVLGENAAGLSEGQAQRLAIARAILSGAPVILLDEATSALDAETERLVLQRIRGMENRTCIAVTHRPAALELADLSIEVRDRKLWTRELPRSPEKK